MGGGFCSLSLICRRLISSDRISGFPGCRANFRDAPAENFAREKSPRRRRREGARRAENQPSPVQGQNICRNPAQNIFKLRQERHIPFAIG
jgi:hypothetical protein